MEILVTPGKRFAIGWIDGLSILYTPDDWSMQDWLELGDITVESQSSVHVHPVTLLYAPGRPPTPEEQQIFFQRAPELRAQRVKRLAFLTDRADTRDTAARMYDAFPVRVDWRPFACAELEVALTWLRAAAPFRMDEALALFSRVQAATRDGRALRERPRAVQGER